MRSKTGTLALYIERLKDLLLVGGHVRPGMAQYVLGGRTPRVRPARMLDGLRCLSLVHGCAAYILQWTSMSAFFTLPCKQFTVASLSS
jgi:hypothetical protein